MFLHPRLHLVEFGLLFIRERRADFVLLRLVQSHHLASRIGLNTLDLGHLVRCQIQGLL